MKKCYKKSTVTLKITLHHLGVRMLERLALMGIFGMDREEVAARFVDEALQRFINNPKIKDIP
jgi:hypothetical protein